MWQFRDKITRHGSRDSIAHSALHVCICFFLLLNSDHQWHSHNAWYSRARVFHCTASDLVHVYFPIIVFFSFLIFDWLGFALEILPGATGFHSAYIHRKEWYTQTNVILYKFVLLESKKKSIHKVVGCCRLLADDYHCQSWAISFLLHLSGRWIIIVFDCLDFTFYFGLFVYPSSFWRTVSWKTIRTSKRISCIRRRDAELNVEINIIAIHHACLITTRINANTHLDLFCDIITRPTWVTIVIFLYVSCIRHTIIIIYHCKQ